VGVRAAARVHVSDCMPCPMRAKTTRVNTDLARSERERYVHMGIARRRRARYSRGYFGRNTTRHYRHSRSSEQALGGYSWGYSWVLRRLWRVFWTTPGVHTRTCARLQPRAPSGQSDVYHRLSHTRTRLPARTAPHRIHFGFYLRRSLCIVGCIIESADAFVQTRISCMSLGTFVCACMCV
jgi:hypothetical protein